MRRSHEHALLLLQKARGDVQVLERVVQDAGVPDWAVGFHAQQAAEKAIKAVLSNQGVEYPRTHNLAALLDQVRRSGLALPPDAEDLPRLTPFGTLLRYEDEAGMGPSEALDRGPTAEWVHRTMAWAESLVGGREGASA